MAYTPPTSPAVLNFTTTYTPPTSPATLNFAVDSTLYPSGFDGSSFGAAVVGTTQYVTPSGVDSLVFGSLACVSTQVLAAFGINPFLMGSVAVSKQIREVYPPTFDPFGSGAPLVAYKERFLLPQWFTTLFIGFAQVGGSRQISPSGFLSEVIGDHRARDNRQLVEQAGGLSDGVFGATFIGLKLREISTRYLPPISIERMGAASIRNNTRYIAPEYVFSQWNNDEYGSPYLYNRNRVIDLVINGIKPPFRSVSPFAEIFNNARAISHTGFEGVFGNQLVADYYRSIYPEGFDSFQSYPQFHVVFNRADVAAPAGIETQVVPSPAIANTRRYMPPVGIAPDDAYGTPFVAPRVRYLEPPIGIQPQLMEGTTIWPGTRAVTPATINWPFPGSSFGNLSFSVIERKLRCSSIVVPPPTWGENRIANRTPQVRPYWDSDFFTSYGVTKIINRNNYAQFQGFQNQAFGQTTQIDYRTLKTAVKTGDFQKFGLLTIRNVIPEPPSAQRIFAEPVDDAVQGSLLMGVVTVKANSIFPEWLDLGSFGTPLVRSNVIYPLGMPFYFDPLYGGQFGLPSLNPTQFILCDTPITPTEPHEITPPRLSPHTIYCTADVTTQAQSNNPGTLFHVIDFFQPNQGYGIGTISLKNRACFQNSINSKLEFGTAFVSTNPRFLTPAGIKSNRFGVPELNDPNNAKVLGIELFTQFGVHLISGPEPFVRFITPEGHKYERFGEAVIDGFHRNVIPQGANETRYGVPFVQRPPPPVTPSGQVFSVWGDNMVAFKIRNQQIQGFDSFVCDYAPGFFDDRMRVTKRNRIHAGGESGQVFGHIGIGPRPMHHIGPDGFTHWPIQQITITHA